VSCRTQRPAVRNQRSDEGDVLGLPPQNGFRHRHQPIKPPGGLHGSQSGDHGDDHADDHSRGTPWRKPNAKHEHEQADARDGPERNSAQASADEKARQENQQLNPDHKWGRDQPDQ
jgi:hypothetical protein